MALASRQHGVVTREQLLRLGVRPQGIKHRLARGRLHRVHRGVYAVGRPDLIRDGEWMAAVLACGDGAAISHATAAALWGIRRDQGPIEVSVPRSRTPVRPGIVVHRRRRIGAELTTRRGIPVTTPVRTLVELALRLDRDRLEAAISEADKLDLIDPEQLRVALEQTGPGPGVAKLRNTLDRRTFVLTDSQLERRFLPLATRAGLPPPITRLKLNGFRVDFYWPDLGLVVETDGLRYHRTPAQQARDSRRDQIHTASGLTPLRFTHAEIRFEGSHVEATLRRVAHVLERRRRFQPVDEGFGSEWATKPHLRADSSARGR
jgi:Transcriptional regulator, AbiEi antitoxin/Protein of unknown function (DUF559)